MFYLAEESLWDIVEREELQALTKTPPTNSFEEMIQLTNEGKLWQFPINNEQGTCVVNIYSLLLLLHDLY